MLPGHILETVAGFITSTISTTGYVGIGCLRRSAIELANIPLPSEIILPFSGFLVAQGRFSLYLVALAGAVGNICGSVFSYYLGMYGGRPWIQRFGKYVLMSRRDLDMADRWFARWGEATAFFSRCLPVIRTFISFPAGIAHVNLPRFPLHSFTGRIIPLEPVPGVRGNEDRRELAVSEDILPRRGRDHRDTHCRWHRTVRLAAHQACARGRGPGSGRDEGRGRRA